MAILSSPDNSYDPYHEPDNENQKLKTNKIDKDLNDVMMIIKQNINKLAERGELINGSECDSEKLKINSQSFKKRSKKLKKEIWWRNFRVKMISLALLITIISTLTIALAVRFG